MRQPYHRVMNCTSASLHRCFDISCHPRPFPVEILWGLGRTELYLEGTGPLCQHISLELYSLLTSRRSSTPEAERDSLVRTNIIQLNATRHKSYELSINVNIFHFFERYNLLGSLGLLLTFDYMEW